MTRAPRCPRWAGPNPNMCRSEMLHAKANVSIPPSPLGEELTPSPLVRDRGRAKRAAAINSVTSRRPYKPEPGWVSCYRPRDELLVWEAMIKFTCD